MNLQVTNRGRVERLFVRPSGASVSVPMSRLMAEVGVGIRDDCHRGARISDVREGVVRRLRAGTKVPVANVRQFSAITREDLEIVSAVMLPERGQIPPELLEPNLVISGVDGFSFSQLPPGSLLSFGDGKAILAVWGENEPCKHVNENILAAFPGVAMKSTFMTAARGRRGVVGFVYCSGVIDLGDEVSVWREVVRQ